MPPTTEDLHSSGGAQITIYPAIIYHSTIPLYPTNTPQSPTTFIQVTPILTVCNTIFHKYNI